MIQTQKKYNYINGIFVEDANGFVIGYQWIDVDNISRRCLYISSVDDLVNKTTSAVCRYEMLDKETNEWVLRKTEISLATMDSYIYPATGALEPTPFENDLTSPILAADGVTIVGYNQKLKAGLVPEFYFFYMAQKPILEPVTMSIQARKFGATSFN